MSDLRERALAREPEGDVEARASWLRARMRTDELCPSRVRLLAYAGDSAACLALGVARGPDPVTDPERFLIDLVEIDLDAACRLALTCSRPLLAGLHGHAPWESRPQEAVDATWAWLETEDLAERESARVAASQAADDAEQSGDELMDLVIEGLEVELAVVAWGAAAPTRLATEIREETLPALAWDVFRELEAGFAELGNLEPGSGRSFLADALEDFRSWCLMTR
ncbi:MAG: hypothetical protein JKY65_16255 [Planctomycetes bacterium]|nr:hypothetical protein [Planctomycetota bacterium]